MMRIMFATLVALGVAATSPAIAQEHQGHVQPMPASAAAVPGAHVGSKAMPEMCKSMMGMGMGMGMGMMDSKMGGGKMGSKMGGIPMADPAKAHPSAPDGKPMSAAQMKKMQMSCGDMMPTGGPKSKGMAMPGYK